MIHFKPGVIPTPKHVPRLFAEDYYSPMASVRIHHVDYSDFQVPMYLNDQLGDCVPAGMGHLFGSWTKYAQGKEVVFKDATVQSVYSAISGYIPGRPQTDVGATLESCLSYTRAHGFGGQKIDAYAEIRNLTPTGLTMALYLYGGVYVAVSLPQSAEDQFNAGQPWTVVDGSPILGGHCITLQGFVGGPDSAKWATWGAIQRSNITWMSQYITEAWAVYSRDFIRPDGIAPNGLMEHALIADMASL